MVVRIELEVELSGGPLHGLKYLTNEIKRYHYFTNKAKDVLLGYMRFQDGLIYYFDEGLSKALSSNVEKAMLELEDNVALVEIPLPEGEENANPES